MTNALFCLITHTIFLLSFYCYMINIRFSERRIYHPRIDIIYLKKYLIKKKSKLNILYLGTECRYDKVPRLFLQSIGFLFLLFNELIIVCLSLSYLFMRYKDLLLLDQIFMTYSIAVSIVFLSYEEIQREKARKKIIDISSEEYEEFKKDIEEEWPGFFCTSKRKKKKR